ncbi:MAG TPA: sugar phosphate isomerase/epimerase family protein [Bryobacteraceae bacterium]|nr:sugar phosphate isomerase/epimerase family protein [Bryobacteraceae bacterium]
MNRRELFTLAGGAALPAFSGPRFRKGIWCMAFSRNMPYAECFRQLRNAGFEGMDLQLGQHVKLSSTTDEVKRMADEARKAGVTIVSMYVAEGLNDNPLNDPSPEVRARGVAAIEKAIEIATILDHCPLLLVPGRLGSGAKFQVGTQATWDRTLAEFRKVVPRAAAAKVIIGPENLWNKFLLSPTEMRSYVDQLKSPWFKVHFDVGNPLQYGYPQDWILTLGKRITRVHLKDYKLSARSEQGRFVDLLEGDVDWKEVMAALKEIGYTGFLSTEAGYSSNDPDQLKKISRAVDRILEMA